MRRKRGLKKATCGDGREKEHQVKQEITKKDFFMKCFKTVEKKAFY
jgi:hypothetical protein